MRHLQSRRDWLLQTSSVVSGAWLAGTSWLRGTVAPTAPVSVARCMTYDTAELLAAMERMFDGIGGLRNLVNGKTVGIKVNLTGAPESRLNDQPVGDTHYTHPQVIATTVHLIGKAGARRIRVLESPLASAGPLEEYMVRANWQPRDILGAAANVEFENTNLLGNGKKYSRLRVPGGGLLFPAYDVNHSYEDCDVYVSLAKMKEHQTAGITLSMKNNFGITPSSIYGSGAGKNEPDENPKANRQTLHTGAQPPARTAPAEKDPNSPREAGYRVPRAVVDLVGARPIDLAIVEGIRTMTGGEGPWGREAKTVVNPGVIVAGRNPVTTDAVCMAVMNFDPMADSGTPPFETCDSTLRLAEEAGIGTRDLKRIEVVGDRIEQVRFDFAGIRKQRRSVRT
jgi:uncharacterized protein (DUF362 family)